MRAYNFGARKSNPTKLYYVTCREASMTTQVEILEGLHPKNCKSKKLAQIVAIMYNLGLSL